MAGGVWGSTEPEREHSGHAFGAGVESTGQYGQLEIDINITAARGFSVSSRAWVPSLVGLISAAPDSSSSIQSHFGASRGPWAGAEADSPIFSRRTSGAPTPASLEANCLHKATYRSSGFATRDSEKSLGAFGTFGKLTAVRGRGRAADAVRRQAQPSVVAEPPRRVPFTASPPPPTFSCTTHTNQLIFAHWMRPFCPFDAPLAQMVGWGGPGRVCEPPAANAAALCSAPKLRFCVFILRLCGKLPLSA